MGLIRADYIFIAALLLIIGAHITTNFLIKYYEDAAKIVGIAEEVSLVMEANPIARFFYGIESVKSIYSFILAPGILTSLYYFIRRKYSKQVVVLEAYAIGFFMFGLLDFLNDFSLLLGVLAWLHKIIVIWNNWGKLGYIR